MLALLPRTKEYIQSPTKTTMPQKLKKRAAHLQNELISTSPSSSQRVEGKLGNTIVVHYSKKHKCGCVCIFFIYYTIYAILSRRKAFNYSLFSQHYSERKLPSQIMNLEIATPPDISSPSCPFLQTPGLCKLDTYKTWYPHVGLKMEKEPAPGWIFLKRPSPQRWIINSLTTRAALHFSQDALRQKRQRCTAGCFSSSGTSLWVAAG